jgi:translation initiation factor IF-1
MSKADLIAMTGIVTESLSHNLFRVKLENGFAVLAHISGQLRLHSTKILPGDRVKVEISPYDLSRGRIAQRLKPQKHLVMPVSA